MVNTRLCPGTIKHRNPGTTHSLVKAEEQIQYLFHCHSKAIELHGEERLHIAQLNLHATCSPAKHLFLQVTCYMPLIKVFHMSE